MNRRIALAAVAVVLALLGTAAVYDYAHNADKRAVARTRAVNVLITQKLIPTGTAWSDVVKGSYLKSERVPAADAPSSALSSLTGSGVADTEVTTTDVAAGQIALRQMFGHSVPTTGLLPIPQDKIAVTVQMSSNADVAGFVENGSQVAIFATFKLQGSAAAATGGGTVGGQDLYATKLLLARVPVIATSQTPPGDLSGKKTVTSTGGSGSVLITLALSQTDAERVILAQQVGQLYLGLLSDHSATAPDGGTIGVGEFKPAPIFAN